MLKKLKKNNKKYLFLFLFNTLFLSHDLYGACSLSFQSITPIVFNWSGGQVDVQGQITISRSTSGNNRCRRFHITMNGGTSNSYNPRYISNSSSNLSYNLYKNSNRTRIVYHHPYANRRTKVIGGRFHNNQVVKTVNFYARMDAISALSLLDSGYYQDSITARVYKGSFPFVFLPIEDSESFLVSTYYPPTIDISLISSGGTFDPNDTYENLDFGVLTTGTQKGFDLRVKSNTAYKVLFSSSNNGVLKEATMSSSISYILKVNGAIKDLQGSSTIPKEVATGIQTGGTSGLHPVSVTIGTTENKLEGHYQDIITIEAQAL